MIKRCFIPKSLFQENIPPRLIKLLRKDIKITEISVSATIAASSRTNYAIRHGMGP